MKRYSPKDAGPFAPAFSPPIMKPDADGEWVRYSDHLEDKIRTLEGFRKVIEPLDPARAIAAAEFDRETAYAKGAVYGMEHEREKIAQELEAEYRRLVDDWNQGIGTFDRACAAQFAADFVRRGGKG